VVEADPGDAGIELFVEVLAVVVAREGSSGGIVDAMRKTRDQTHVISNEGLKRYQ